jgi:hypothetical protein
MLGVAEAVSVGEGVDVKVDVGVVVGVGVLVAVGVSVASPSATRVRVFCVVDPSNTMAAEEPKRTTTKRPTMAPAITCPRWRRLACDDRLELAPL